MPLCVHAATCARLLPCGGTPHDAAWRHGADRACSHKGTAGLGRVVGMRAREGGGGRRDGGIVCAEAVEARIRGDSGEGGAERSRGATEGGSTRRGMQLSEG